MKQALILGITGTFGSHVARALKQKGYSLRALVRDKKSLDSSLAGVEQIVGSVTDHEALQEASQGCGIVVYGINPAGYDWENKALPWLERVARLAEEKAMTLLFPGNVYVYDPSQGQEFNERSGQHPITRKGEIRKAMEQHLRVAAENGARVIIVRAGDFIAADANSAWLQFLLKRSKQGYVLSNPGVKELKHSWAYLPDLADTVAALLEQRAELPAFNEFHFKGYQYSFIDIADAIEKATGKPVKITGFPWLMIRLLAPFSVLYRGLYEMRYLWQYEINLNDDPLQAIIKRPVANTPLAHALLQAQLI